MPTILVVNGWRVFFYMNESQEPIHVHCQKAEKECEYWLDRDNFDVEEAFAYNMNSKDRREIKQIIYEHFDLIEAEWDKLQGGQR